MKILFVMQKRVDAGSIQAAANYTRVGDELGHTIAIYGRPDPSFPGVRFSAELSGYDRNHWSDDERSEWLEHFEGLVDKILQPTLEPRERGVMAVPFFGYDPSA